MTCGFAGPYSMTDWEDFDKAFDELEEECTEIIRGLTVRLWNSILSKSPQYHGRFVASWSYQLNLPDPQDRSDSVDPEGNKIASYFYDDMGAFQGLYRGHPIAIAVANQASNGRDKQFKLGDTVYFTNGVDHGEGPYSVDIEVGNIQLRAENRPGAPVARTLDLVTASYLDISYNQGAALKLLKI